MRRPDSELIGGPPFAQPKTWETTIKTHLEPLSGHAQWRKDWVKVSSELAQDRRAESASIRDVTLAQPAPGEWRHKYKVSGRKIGVIAGQNFAL